MRKKRTIINSAFYATHPQGGYSGYFKDFEGIIAVAYNPFWKLNENNNLIL